MQIKQIDLKNFRNYINQTINLKDGINIFFGDNAQGKTNILESIFICSMGKSFRTKKEKEIINYEKNESKIEISFEKSDREGKIELELNDKKTFFINGIKIKKLSEILGNIQIVLFSPDDINILKGNPSNRRKFLDIMISQLKPAYIYNLNQYIRILDQRNNYLRQIKYENKSEEMLEIWDEKLLEIGNNIYQYRKLFIDKINNKINIIHSNITEEKEKVKIEYKSNFNKNEDFFKEIKLKRKTDIQNGYTSIGIHRDDFNIFINDKLVNIYGSQGQNRTVMLSLKLTELEIIQEEINEYPILLLDDFMSELDEKRRNKFLQYIKNNQVLITCTEKINIEDRKIKLYKVENGKVFEEK